MAFCGNCGAELPQEARFCPSCGAEIEADLSAPPLDEPPSVSQSADLHPASLGRRFVAHLLDGLVGLAFFLVIGSNIASMTGNTTSGGFEMEGAPAVWTMLLTSAGMLLYFTFMEAGKRGQSLGKRIMGIRVVTLDGQRISRGASFQRNLLRVIDGIGAYVVGALVVLFNAQNRRIGDLVAGTWVIRQPKDAASGTDEDGKGRIRFSMGQSSGFVD